jgi:phospholipase C
MKDGGSSGGGMLCATYAVRPGDTLTRQFPLSMFADSAYSIEVLGPNGFYRSFTGQSAPLPLSVHTSYERQGVQLTGNVQVHLLSKSAKPVSITMKDNSYKSDLVTRTIKPSEETSVVVHLQKSHGWYDFTVKADGSNNEARYAGRVETGMAGFSDPLIGQVVRAT